MTDEITAAAEVVLGIEIEKFLETDLAKYLIGCGEQDRLDAIEELSRLNPYDFTELGALQSAIAKAQRNVLLGEKVQGYLSDAIIRGNQAEEVLANIEET